MTVTGADPAVLHDAHNARVDAFNLQDSAGVAAGYTEHAVVHDPQHSEPIRGRDEVRRDYQAFFTAFPDAHVETLTFLNSDGAIGYHIVIRATHAGPIATADGDVPPTGRSVELSAAVIAHVDAAGMLKQVWRFLDTASLANQLGLE